MRNINTSIFDFPTLRDAASGYVYVDKTAQLYELAKPTAGSTLIFDALKANNKAPVDFATTVGVKRLDAPDALDAPTVALLYQGGYLTIEASADDNRVHLKIPNREVFDSIYDGYVASLLGKGHVGTGPKFGWRF